MAAAPVRILALLAALPLALSACGQTSKDSTKDFQGDQKAVAQTVEDLQKAASKSDEDKICGDLLAPALVARIKATAVKRGDPKGTCQTALNDALKDADSFELQVKEVAISGTTATATVQSEVTGSKKRDDSIRLTKVGNSWKIATLGAASAS
jgi:Domain of unknown function (DUF4878)